MNTFEDRKTECVDISLIKVTKYSLNRERIISFTLMGTII